MFEYFFHPPCGLNVMFNLYFPMLPQRYVMWKGQEKRFYICAIDSFSSQIRVALNT